MLKDCEVLKVNLVASEVESNGKAISDACIPIIVNIRNGYSLVILHMILF